MIGRKRSYPTLSNERDFPHVVEILLPLDGLDVRMSRDIATFHSSRDIRPRFGRVRKQNDQQYCRYCFSDLETADAFREQFGGNSLPIKPRPRLELPSPAAK
jgi:hypothetical protein